jgi:hypothetical protein
MISAPNHDLETIILSIINMIANARLRVIQQEQMMQMSPMPEGKM